MCATPRHVWLTCLILAALPSGTAQSQNATQLVERELKISESPLLTGAGLSRRGVQSSTQLLGADVRLFIARGQNVLRLGRPVGGRTDDQAVQGFSTTYSILPKEALHLKATYLEDQDQAISFPSVDAGSQKTAGKAYGVLATSSLLEGGLKGEAEVVFSQLDPNRRAGHREQSDQAVRMKVGGALRGLNWEGEYQRIGREFRSPANPGLARDREGGTFDIKTSLGPTSYSVTVSRFHTNVDADPLLPRETRSDVKTTVGVSLPSYPVLAFTYQRSHQEISRYPLGPPTSGAITDEWQANLSYTQASWNAALNSSYSVVQAKVGPAVSLTTMKLGLTGGMRSLPFLTLKPSLGFARTTNQTAHLVADSYQAALTSESILVSNALLLSTQGSYQETTPVAGLAHLRTLSGLARLTCSLSKNSLFKDGNETISFRMNYHRTASQIRTPQPMDDLGVFVTFDLTGS